MPRRPFSALLFLLCSPGSFAADKAPLTPQRRFELVPYGYRLDAWNDKSRVGFLTDTVIAVTINQYGPTKETLEKQQKTGMGNLDDWFQGPPVKTLVFDIDKNQLITSAELGNERVGTVFLPTREGRFIVSTDRELRLYDSGLTLLNSLTVEGVPVAREIEISLDGRWIVFRYGPKKGLVLSTDDLTPDASAQSCSEFRFTGNRLLPMGGKQIDEIRAPVGSQFVQVSRGGTRFILDAHYNTRLDTLFHFLDFERPANEQWLRVIETETGRVVFETKWDRRKHEMFSAISPSGQRLALLRNGILEILDLPKLSSR